MYNFNIKKEITAITMLAFLLWIIPLGAFIDVSEEGAICGGKRAICQCSHNFQKNSSPSAIAAKIRGGYDTSKGQSRLASETHFLFKNQDFFHFLNRYGVFYGQDLRCASLPVVRRIEHVPKTAAHLF